MAKHLLIFSVLSMCIAQISSATEATFQPNMALGPTIANISASAAIRNASNISSGDTVITNDEISRAVDNLASYAKQKEYQRVRQARLISRPTVEDFSEFKKWAEQGNVDYQIELAVMYDQGEGVHQDHSQAAEWYGKAANQGDAGAQYNLGVMYYRGEGVHQDYTKAMELYKKAANQGKVSSQYYLASMYEKGEGVPQDYTKAMDLYKKAANQGDADAQYNLGVMYKNGEGIRRNDTKAAEWYGKAANQGHIDAQYSLGGMHVNGEGVTKDYIKAMELYKRAANQGHAKAQYNLGVMHYKGQGASKDKNIAKKYFEQSCNNGHKSSCNNYSILMSDTSTTVQDNRQVNQNEKIEHTNSKLGSAYVPSDSGIAEGIRIRKEKTAKDSRDRKITKTKGVLGEVAALAILYQLTK